MSKNVQDGAVAEERERRRTPRKKKKSQIPYAIVVVCAIAIFAMYLGGIGSKLASGLLLGVGFGYVLQRSRFCFAASWRDPSLTGSTTLTRAVLLAFALTTIGFTAIKYAAFVKGEAIPGAGSVGAIGLPLILGGFLFGIGMVCAGGCASGTLMRIGEGFTMQLIVLVFFAIGNLIGGHNLTVFWSEFNKDAPRIFLPDVLGWAGGLVLQLLVIALLYIAAVKWQKKKLGSDE